ncbi:hypothetical protein DYBT9275_00088 [Dyadobacter sp. CECT 9275]|uniref:NAD(P)-binding domain-containing protein n=1 Tax=Dyadobacter helix TaxID=2822344 RepID=A0A916J7W4_9BACT|nr:NAD(P)H-binding protein [Dyadobacter sp. CECT 9275]CAG4988472.1 hypothetical protein DYBT9275_00088 [Dyadobacter sp. CECT 9275]
MKYIITGSLGNISLPVTENLVKDGHEVTVISSNPGKKEAIEKLGAKPAIGSVTDASFLSDVFRNADVAYLMVPSDFSAPDYPKLQREIADHYVGAIAGSSITHVVLLSSIGAHLRQGAGPIDGLGYLEERLLELKDVHTKFLRPSYFFNNLYSQAGLISHAGIAGSNFGNTEEKLVLVHTGDIAIVASRYLLDLSFTGNSITYISSDERHPNEIAELLGKSVDKEGIPWITFTDEQAQQGMVDGGLSPGFADLYVKMGRAIREGKLQEHYWQNRPEVLGTYKLEDFVKAFSLAYHKG